jgi:hypothetical protein
LEVRYFAGASGIDYISRKLAPLLLRGEIEVSIGGRTNLRHEIVSGPGISVAGTNLYHVSPGRSLDIAPQPGLAQPAIAIDDKLAA